MNTIKHLVPLLSLLGLLALAGTAQAARDPAEPFESWKGENESGQFDFDESQVKPWQESDTQVPPLPSEDDLLVVRLDTLPQPFTAHIGASTFGYDPNDRVFRYWLVITSPAGAYNATYEGMRCDTAEYKVYAHGNPRRAPSIRPAPTGNWQRVDPGRRGEFHAELARTLMCTESSRSRPAAEVLDILRGRRAYRNPSADNDF